MTKVSELLITQIRLATVEMDNLKYQIAQIQVLGQQKFSAREALVEAARVEVGAAVGDLLDLESCTFRSSPNVAKPTPAGVPATPPVENVLPFKKGKKPKL